MQIFLDALWDLLSPKVPEDILAQRKALTGCLPGEPHLLETYSTPILGVQSHSIPGQSPLPKTHPFPDCNRSLLPMHIEPYDLVVLAGPVCTFLLLVQRQGSALVLQKASVSGWTRDSAIYGHMDMAEALAMGSLVCQPVQLFSRCWNYCSLALSICGKSVAGRRALMLAPFQGGGGTVGTFLHPSHGL